MFFFVYEGIPRRRSSRMKQVHAAHDGSKPHHSPTPGPRQSKHGRVASRLRPWQLKLARKLITNSPKQSNASSPRSKPSLERGGGTKMISSRPRGEATESLTTILLRPRKLHFAYLVDGVFFFFLSFQVPRRRCFGGLTLPPHGQHMVYTLSNGTKRKKDSISRHALSGGGRSRLAW